MRKRFFSLLSFVFMAFGLSAQSLVFHECGGGETVVTLPADMHIEASSGVVTFSSGSKSVAIPLGSVLAVTFRSKTGDVNGDTQVDVADIATIISIMAGKGGDTEPENPDPQTPDEEVYTSCPDDDHPHMIDLGLPSGTKWACCNVWATTPEGYGCYYAWGEVHPKTEYSWAMYIHCDGSQETCHYIGSDIAGTMYDAATDNWKAPWRMPTKEQFQELSDNCTYEWTKQNGVKGMVFTGPNDSTIFLPAAGEWAGSTHIQGGSVGAYWSSTLDNDTPSNAWYFIIVPQNANLASGGRGLGGLPVRPVCND